MPALLSDLAPNEHPIFLPRLLSQRPALAALVAETISTWSYAEHTLGRSVAIMSGGINGAEMEDYIEQLWLPARMKIIRRVATAELADPYLPTFLKVIEVIAGFARRRHAFAHGVWGIVEALPDALLLVAPEHILRHFGAAHDWLATFIEGGPEAVNWFRPLDNRHVEVWSEQNLKDEVTGMNKAYELALAAESIAGNDPFDTSDAKRVHST